MTTFIECDWCTRPIDPDDGYTADEYNRMGFEGVVDDHAYVVMEARFGHKNGRTSTFGHFHFPDCYHAALRMLRDHGRWAEARDTGPDAAVIPRWTKDGELQDVELAARKQPDREERLGIANAEGGIGWLPGLSLPTFKALMNAGVLTIKELEALCADGSLAELPRIGPKRLQEAQAALHRDGATG